MLINIVIFFSATGCLT